jgi:hypothetical protein
VRLTFEKAVIFTLVLILFISTANIYSHYINLWIYKKEDNTTFLDPWDASRSITALLEADKLYRQGRYDEAIYEYSLKLSMTDSLALDQEQKAYAHFAKGMCQYKLKEYDKAQDSFSSSLIYDPDNAAAYNNAAVSAFYAKNYKDALEYEKKAIELLPAVEYFYNMGRIYESLREYKLAAQSFLSVVKGGENVTLIDPVRVYNKVTNLVPDLDKREEIAKGVIVSLKLRNYGEVLTIEDTDMDILDTGFSVSVYDSKDGKKLRVSYDRETNDPYHLINSLSWKVESGSTALYRSSRDSFTMGVFENNNYKITLTIKYKGSLERERQTYILVTKEGYREYKGVDTLRPNQQSSKIYENAVYEQLFDKNFKLSYSGYYDRFNVMWSMDNLKSRIMTVDYRDSGSSLHLLNDLDKDAGIRANLSTLLTDKDLRGKKVSIRFWARKITSKETMTVNVRVGNRNYPFRDFDLQYKWKLVTMDFDIPEDAKNFTFSLTIKPGEEIKLDGFIIVVK